MRNKKLSFVLFSTIILVFIFSFSIIKIYETKSMNSYNLILQYENIQAKNHLSFLEKYIKSLKSLNTTNRIDIKNPNYKIYAIIKNKNKEYEINIFSKSNNRDISLHKKIFIQKANN